MFKGFLLLLTLIVATLSYLPLRSQNTFEPNAHRQLLIQMDHSNSLYLNRASPEKRFQILSQQLTYDEQTDTTQFTPFNLTAYTGDLSIQGSSLHAQLHDNQFQLQQQVHVQQSAPNQPTRQLTSEQLNINLQTHLLSSPSHITMYDDQQRIQADSLIGNYEEGWYEFTQRVHTYWR